MALVKDWVISGEGFGLMPHFLCAADVEAGRLKLVLKDWHGPAGPVHVVYPNQRFVPAKVRAFVECLIEAASEIKWNSGAE
jgi:DNA-binding transcriptional LysR family regulator